MILTVLRKPLLIVDGDNLAHRAYHSTPKSVKGEGGRPINAIVGFFSMLSRVWSEVPARGIFVAWDTLGVDTYRNRLWPPYQGGRIFDPEIVEQINRLPDLCRPFGFGVGKAAGFEADDIMAAAARSEVAQGGSALLFTTDRDAYQLVCEEIFVLAAQRGTRELSRIGPREVVERMGVLPEQVPDFKALSGDASDKIPGIRGVGPKAASSLLLRYGTLDRIVEAWGDTEDSKLALTFREVVTMRPEVPVVLPDGPPDWLRGAAVLREIGAASLAERISQLSL
ncbi:5'-3' exonuclease [Fimbriimonas ginsengisoli]|uniref:5'-3' exonuclease n=1 Tax=Fimbriimonas ginsengisoli Gsoil 348 TaxID=661478 RepID=A0A068NYZ4_FIMGI|nr:5'-3' exonuclease H3TH domain-containing protein [Fimbriimonas ginsengisoli]AIE87679.1 DNA polymerase I [Fimbriimonas ginsengisoli Gsoil 348]